MLKTLPGISPRAAAGQPLAGLLPLLVLSLGASACHVGLKGPTEQERREARRYGSWVFAGGLKRVLPATVSALRSEGFEVDGKHSVKDLLFTRPRALSPREGNPLHVTAGRRLSLQFVAHFAQLSPARIRVTLYPRVFADGKRVTLSQLNPRALQLRWRRLLLRIHRGLAPEPRRPYRSVPWSRPEPRPRRRIHHF